MDVVSMTKSFERMYFILILNYVNVLPTQKDSKS
jgi:hypothetical protein